MQERVQKYYEEKARSEAKAAAAAAEAHAAALHRQSIYTNMQHKTRGQHTSTVSNKNLKTPWGRRSTPNFHSGGMLSSTSVLRASFGNEQPLSDRKLKRLPSDSPAVVKVAAKALADATKAERALLKHRSESVVLENSSQNDIEGVSVRVVKVNSSGSFPSFESAHQRSDEAKEGTRQEPDTELNARTKQKAPLPSAAYEKKDKRDKNKSVCFDISKSRMENKTLSFRQEDKSQDTQTSESAYQKAKRESNRYRTGVATHFSERIHKLNGEVPKICPCDNIRNPLDPYYTLHCARNCPLYRNPSQYQIALQFAIHTMGLD